MDILKSLREDHQSFAGSLGRLETLLPQGRPAEPAAAEEAGNLMRALEPRFQRHEELEHKYLFPEIRGLNRKLDAAVERDEAGNARIEREMKECRRLLAASALDDELVREAEAESFPASDPPSWTLGREPLEAEEGELAREIHRFVKLLRRHLRIEDAVIYPAADKRIRGRRRAQITIRVDAAEFPDFIDKGGGD